MNRIVNRAIATVIALLAPVLVLLLRGWYADITPDPLPSHWNASNVVDNTADATALFVTVLALSAGFAAVAVIMLWVVRSTGVARMLLCSMLFAGWIAVTVYVTILVASAHVRTAEQVKMSWWLIAVMVLVPLAAAVAVWLLTPPDWIVRERAATSTIDLAPNERITWISEAHSIPARWAAGIGVVAGGALMIFVPPVAIPIFVVGIVLMFVAEIGVRVDATGLHTLWGPFGWPHSRIGLDRIAVARAESIRPAQWGGWGYRVTPRGTGAIVRGGPAIIVDRVSGPRYAVTVDRAEEGADVLNALLARAQQSGGRQPE